jgi:hypothetical protein
VLDALRELLAGHRGIGAVGGDGIWLLLQRIVLVSATGKQATRQEARPAFIRDLLRRATPIEDSPTYEEAVALLARSARAGKVTAQIALERALRADEGGSEPEGELARLLRGDD